MFKNKYWNYFVFWLKIFILNVLIYYLLIWYYFLFLNIFSVFFIIYLEIIKILNKGIIFIFNIKKYQNNKFFFIFFIY